MDGVVLFKILFILSIGIIIVGLIAHDFFDDFNYGIKQFFDKMIVNYILLHPEKFDFEIFDLGQNYPYGGTQNLNDFMVKARLGKFSHNLFWTRKGSVSEVRDFIKEKVEESYKENHKAKVKPIEIFKVTIN